MSFRAQILLIVLLPLAVVAGLVLGAWSVRGEEIGPGRVMRVELPPAVPAAELPDIAGAARSDLPLVVIDAGHGGHDPGASGQGYRESDLVLALAKALRDQLLSQGGVRVAMTREDNSFLLLTERFEIARRLGADLFVSIHADSAGESAEVAGASIYTLSNAASSKAAARFAARENATDRINGQMVGDQSDTVSAILVELSQRRTQEESAEFARLIAREGEGVIRFHPQAQRSAALKVLQAPDVPSVLYESGFITNETEAQRLASPEGRRQFAEVLARAIRIYFARQQES